MDKKALTLPILVSLVVGNMIGTGIYLLPASLAPFGFYSLFAWGFTSLGALFLALAFAHLSKRFRQTGGPVIYCRQAFGHLPGFLVAYIYWASNLVSIAGLAISSVGYLGYLFPSLNATNPAFHPAMVLVTELGIVWLFTLINLIGIHTAGVTQLYLTIIKVLPLLLIAVVGLHHVHLANFTLPASQAGSTDLASSPMLNISRAAALTFWAFIGLESATVPSESTQGYQTIYKATIYGTLITAFVYILSSYVLQGMIPASRLAASQFPFAEAAIVLFGQPAALVIALCAFISGVGALNGCMLLQGQIVYAAARDRYFPKQFSKLSKHDVPISGQVFSSSLICVLLIVTMQPSLLKQFDHVALLAALLTLITYLFTAMAEVKFVLKDRLWKSVPMLVAGISVIYSLWMIGSFQFVYLITALGLMLVILPFYFITVKKRKA